jgi:hypothetical protein
METMLTDLPDWIKGDWCNVELAEQVDDPVTPETVEEIDHQFLKCQWARDLLGGDLKDAHKSWGRWQGFSGGDPWEDQGWRNFLELQRFGERLWNDFDASRFRDFVWLRTYISYWSGAD